MNQATQQHAIIWPVAYLLGTTDNFASSEIIVAELSARVVWAQLDDIARWPTYYSNVTDICFHDGSGPLLSMGTRSRFTTFGSPIEVQITKYAPLVDGQAARVIWDGWVEGDATTRLDVIHTWLFEDSPGGRVRILIQELQIGVPAQELVRMLSSPMINGHRE